MVKHNDCTPTPIEHRPATSDGRLEHYTSTCCGMEIANTVRTNVEAEVREHVAYMTAKRSKESPR